MPNHQATQISVISLKFDSQEYPTFNLPQAELEEYDSTRIAV